MTFHTHPRVLPPSFCCIRIRLDWPLGAHSFLILLFISPRCLRVASAFDPLQTTINYARADRIQHLLILVVTHWAHNPPKNSPRPHCVLLGSCKTNYPPFGRISDPSTHPINHKMIYLRTHTINIGLISLVRLTPPPPTQCLGTRCNG